MRIEKLRLWFMRLHEQAGLHKLLNQTFPNLNIADFR